MSVIIHKDIIIKVIGIFQDVKEENLATDDWKVANLHPANRAEQPSSRCYC